MRGGAGELRAGARPEGGRPLGGEPDGPWGRAGPARGQVSPAGLAVPSVGRGTGRAGRDRLVVRGLRRSCRAEPGRRPLECH